MIEKIEGFVIDTVKHNDKNNVVTLYTRSRGRMAFLVPVANTKASRLRSATLTLMAVVGADVNLIAGKELHTLRCPQPVRLWHGIYSNPVKISILYFMAEFCGKLVRQYPPDENLWTYILQSLETLDSLPGHRLANFHLAFLIGMLSIAGILPSPSRAGDGEIFDMQAADFTALEEPAGSGTNPRRVLLTAVESNAVEKILKMNFRNMDRYRFTRAERQTALDRLLQYYSLHLPIGREYRTLPVLRDLFAD